jgi:hypothetical protein
MRLAPPYSFVIFLFPFVVEGQEAPPAETALTDIRKEMLSEYRYAAPGIKPAKLPTSLQSDSPAFHAAGTDEGVVKMEAFEVRESGFSSSATQSIEQHPPSKPPATVASKLGIGEHDFEVGKVHAFVITIFYVPFIAGFRW